MTPEARIRKVRAELRARKLDGLLVSLPANITYLTGYPSRDSYLLVSQKENIYFTDSRYTAEARAALGRRAPVRQVKASVFKEIAETACSSQRLKSIGFEQRHLPYAEYDKIKGYLDYAAVFIPTHGIVEGLRQVKDAQELSGIREAAGITKEALKFIEKKLTPGMKEIEVVAELEHFIRYRGAADSAFEIIAAGGPNSAFAHHIPTARKLRDCEPVLIDIGVDVRGYKSDLTRVFFLGKINTLTRRIFDIVRAAQERAIARVRPGVTAGYVDSASREFIIKKGYGKYFKHNCGHGVGLEVHEAPHISPGSKERLKPGMVFTVEPAIYLPGKFGIRIEDMVLVTDKGHVKL